MKTIVFVVEGQTELIFTQQFIDKLVSLSSVHVTHQKLRNGIVSTIGCRGVSIENADIVITILNAEGDNSVNSYILSRWQEFKKKNVYAVYGLRDRYSGSGVPIDYRALEAFFEEKSREWGIYVRLIVAVEEIEAWFLAVPSFFQRIDENLTEQRVIEILGSEISDGVVESIRHPAQSINRVLNSVSKRYTKRLDDTYSIATKLDYDCLYLEKSADIQALKKFVDALELSLAPPSVDV
ncbi:hypothetical protein OYT1_ch1402 [Ferriphaselus amnicola]|uniref:DUF4276 family protein n=1 Tax=Ferriphaselus amnicola TaxID=1188319 RepID=A0A2Z6GCC1_9PROT|nr:hypothetical protein [Ferriphaselus amnicola]BBE50959.1 hypothetical protein OYT1_ch1402 [Ferriphaselus amnicola]